MAVECLESSRRDFYVLLAQRQLHVVGGQGVGGETRAVEPGAHGHAALAVDADIGDAGQILQAVAHVAVGVVGGDRKSVVEGKSVSVRLDLGGRRSIKKKPIE